MLVEIAIADAYGAGFEYVNDKNHIAKNTLSGYIKHPKHSLLAGQYTDDTQMSIAIANVIIKHDKYCLYDFADAFLTQFKQDSRDGYARGFQLFLENTNTTQEFMKNIISDSIKNGAAMRSVPLGYIENIRQLKETAVLQASLTHNTDIGVESSKAVALMSNYFIYDRGPKRKLGEFVDFFNQSKRSWNIPYNDRVLSEGWMAVCAAITLIKKHNKLSELLKACVNQGGDTDTVASIAVGCACNSKEYIKDLPKVLYDTLENSTYGKDYLDKLDNILKQKFTNKAW